MFDFSWPSARNGVCTNPQPRNTGGKQLIEPHENRRGLFSGRSTTPGNRRKGISDVDPGSTSGTISGTLPPLSPGTGAGFWLHDPVHTGVMGSGIPARKESHGGGCAPRDIGSGFDGERSGRLK